MNYYGILDKNGYCYQIINNKRDDLSKINTQYILLDDMNEEYVNRKYDVANKSWTNEFLERPDIEPQPTNADILAEVKKAQSEVIDEYTLELMERGVL
ncbi:MAG: hypothetical protein SOY97_04665 [Candidatus Metalachnospira sp.]|jgi:hypothetical protein|nr:hypothetical protein [Candidatus Metalachnospira sp.]